MDREPGWMLKFQLFIRKPCEKTHLRRSPAPEQIKTAEIRQQPILVQVIVSSSPETPGFTGIG